MKKKVKFISYAFLLLWILGVVYRILSDSSFTGQVTYTTLDLITDGSLVIAIIGFLVGIFLKKPAKEKKR